MAFVELIDVQKSFGRHPAVDSFSLARGGGGVRHFPGRLGLRKDHDAAHDRRVRDPHGRPHPHQGRGRGRGPPEQAGRRDGISELRPVSEHDGGPEHRFRAESRGAASAGDCSGGSRRCSLSSTWKSSAAATRTRCRGGSSSAWPLPGPWPFIPAFSSSMSRSRPWTRRSACGCARRSAQSRRKLGITTIYVTHDQEEALSISDRVVVMKDGRIEQVGTPVRDLQPARHCVRRLVHRVIERAAGHRCGSFTGESLRGRPGDRGSSIPFTGASGEEVRLTLRPESLALQNGVESNNHLRGTLANVIFLGSIVRLVVNTGTTELLMDTFNNPAPCPSSPGVRGHRGIPSRGMRGARRLAACGLTAGRARSSRQ